MTVIYARIPDPLKTALDTYSTNRHVKLTAAMVELMETGLEAVANRTTVMVLQQRLEAAQADAVASRELAAQSDNARQALAAQMEAQANTYAVIGGRLNQEIGRCPNPSCGKPVTGRDLLVRNACGICNGPLSALIDPKGPRGTLNGTEYLLMIGALGLLAGIALAQAKSS